jgi:hypothetical protein
MAQARGESCFFYDDEFGRYAAVTMFLFRRMIFNITARVYMTHHEYVFMQGIKTPPNRSRRLGLTAGAASAAQSPGKSRVFNRFAGGRGWQCHPVLTTFRPVA